MRPYSPPPDFTLYRTADGSHTLRSAELGEQYHSVHGAVQESRHVFIQHGLFAIDQSQLAVLEVGLGTGLNLLLTWIEADARGLKVDYTALEPHPLPLEVVRALDHPGVLAATERTSAFQEVMAFEAGAMIHLSPDFCFQRSATPVQELDAVDAFDLVYFDAFGPTTQPELWTTDVFRTLHRAMRQGALLVTYCAKGAVRRAMQEAGFHVERLPGPPGKREMLRAKKKI